LFPIVGHPREAEQDKEVFVMGTVIAPSLYEQVGGIEVVETVVDDFIGRILADQTLSPLLAGINLPALRRYETLILCCTLGGPNLYAGRNVREAHEGLTTTSAQYGAIADHLRASLAAFAAPGVDIDQVMARIAQIQNNVVRQ
jgi:hemoglobin